MGLEDDGVVSPEEEARSFIEEMQAKGIVLTAEGVDLVSDDPDGRMTDEDEVRLRQMKPHLLAYLYAVSGNPPPPVLSGDSATSQHVPLSNGKRTLIAFRDGAILAVASTLLSATLTFTSRVGLWSAVIVPFVGFVIIGCLIRDKRYNHLSNVAFIAWGMFFLYLLCSGNFAVIGLWIFALPLCILTAYIAGWVSLLFVREPPQSGQG